MPQKYSWISNMFYTLKDAVAYNKWVAVLFVLKILLAIAVPLLGTLTSTFVVQVLTSGTSVSDYLWVVGALAGGTVLASILKLLVDDRYSWNCTFARCTLSWMRLTDKIIYTDFDNIEPRDRRSLFYRGFSALDSNWVGIEGTMKEIPDLFIGLIGMVSYAIVIAFYVPWVLLILLGMVVANILFSEVAFKYVCKIDKEMEKNYQETQVLTKDCTDKENAKDVRSYRLQKWFVSLFKVLNHKFFVLERNSSALFSIANISDSLFLFARDAVAYALLIPLVLNGQMDLATLVFAIGLLASFSTWVNSFTMGYHQVTRFSVIVSDYRNCLNVKDNWGEGKKDTATLSRPISITFDHVSFAYPGAQEETLKDLNFTIKAGEKIALVGNNGAGKTTLVKLLSGLYKPTKGQILLNGTNILEFDHESYYQLISAVFQDVQPLALSVLNNVTCARKEDSDMEKFWRVTGEAGIKDKILSLPKKEDTCISETFDPKGVRFSGGESQKLLLARALYKNGPILLLDEPTAALDPLSEEKMYREYVSFAEGNTSIFISHRLASTKFADRIIFLADGQIEEEGTHQELLAKKGLYAETFALQAKYYKEEQEHGTIA